MTTFLLYLVIAAAIGLVVFAISVLIFGRGEQMAALSPRVSPAELPDEQITPDDIRKVRFGLALRGYRMSDVDWTLARVGEEIGRLRAELGLDPAPDQAAPDEPIADEPVPDELVTDESGSEESEPDGPAPGEPGEQVDLVKVGGGSAVDVAASGPSDDAAPPADPADRSPR